MGRIPKKRPTPGVPQPLPKPPEPPETPEAPEPKGEAYPLHGGRVVGSILKEHNVKYVFGIPATHVWALETGFHEHGIKRIHMRHQQAAAYAADAYARCTRSPGICFGTAGMGVTDSVGGINQAWHAHSPVIGLFGMHEWDQSGRGTLQEVYPSRICETMTKWSIDIDDRRLVPLYLRWALRDSMVYPPGPIVLGLTMRALGSIRDEDSLLGDVPKEAMAWPSATPGDPAAIDRAVDLLLNSERPVIVAGEGVYWSEAASELQELVELLNIPVNMRRMARGAVPEDHPLAVGGAYRADFWSEADAIMIVGLRLGWFERGGMPPAWPRQAKRIVVHESATDGWAPLPTEEFILGSPKLVLRQMIERSRRRVGQVAQKNGWLEHLALCRRALEEGLAEDEAEYEKHIPIHPWILSREIAGFLDPSATIILDSFLCSTYLSDRIKAKFPGQILDSGEAGGHGHGIGMGIGAQLARPGKQVIVLASDTSMGIAGGDIETALRYNLPVVYVVCNTGSVTGGAHCWFQGQVDSWDMLPNVRYDKLSEVLGCHGEYVAEPQEIGAALYRAFTSGKAAVVNVAVDNRIVHPWFESLSIRLGVIVHQLDVNKVPEPFRSYLLEGRTAEVEMELQRLGIPRGRTRKKVLAFDRVPCVG